MNKKLTFLSFAIALLIIIILVFLLVNGTDDSVQSERKESNKLLLAGEWLRTDASYLIKINKVNTDRTLEAQYFNPKPINVGSATWKESYGNLEITVELQDVNYPGSKYTLSYLHDRDVLAGNYFQAVQELDFYVEFTRRR